MAAAASTELSEATRAILEEIAAGGGRDYTLEQLLAAKREAAEKLNPFAAAAAPADKRYANFAATNLVRDYEQALAMTAMVSYLFCMVEEHFARDPQLYENAPRAKADVLRFLNHFFEYDPNKHVAELRKKTVNKEARQRFAKHTARVRELAQPEKVAEAEAAVEAFAARAAELSDKLKAMVAEAKATDEGDTAAQEAMHAKMTQAVQELEAAKAAHEKGKELARKARQYSQIKAAYEKQIPYDFYYWFGSYFRSNYEALREATQALYPVRSYLEEMLIIYPGVYASEDEAAVARRKLGSERLPIHTAQVGVPVIIGPTKDNIDRTEFTGPGWEVFKGIMEFHQREAEMGQQMLSHIAKVRKTREGVEVADPQKVQEFAQFCQALREAGESRTLTEKEKAVLAAEQERQSSGQGDEVPAALTQAVSDLRGERSAIENAEIVAEIPEDCLATQLVGANPETGELINQTVYFKSEEAQAEELRAAAERAEEIPPVIITGK